MYVLYCGVMVFKYCNLFPIIIFSVVFNIHAESENTQLENSEDLQDTKNTNEKDNNKSKDEKLDNNQVKSSKTEYDNENDELKDKQNIESAEEQSNDKLKDEKSSNKLKKCNKKRCKKNNENDITCKEKQLIELNNFLTNLTKSDYKKYIDENSINSIIANVNVTKKMLDDITHKKYNNKTSLKVQVQKFNENVEKIAKQYRELFKLPDQEEQNKTKNNNSLPVINNGKIQSMTSLNWNKDTRNNSNVITNQLAIPNDDFNNILKDGDIINPEYMVVDLSRPLTMAQVEEYYNRKPDKDLPVQDTMPISTSHDDSSIHNKITDKNI